MNAKAKNRTAGKLLRTIAKLDRAWRAAGKQEGKLENRLAFTLGQAYRAGLGTKARKIQNRNAAAVGTLSGWE
jgi:hypothetical protein